MFNVLSLLLSEETIAAVDIKVFSYLLTGFFTLG